MKNLCPGSDKLPTDPVWKDDRRLRCRECDSLVRVKQDGKMRKHPKPAEPQMTSLQSLLPRW